MQQLDFQFYKGRFRNGFILFLSHLSIEADVEIFLMCHHLTSKPDFTITLKTFMDY